MNSEAPKYPVRTLEKAIEIMNIMYKDGDFRGMGITELSEMSGLNKSVVHRIMDTLLFYDIIEKDPNTSRYRLGWGLYTLAQKVPQQNHLCSISMNYLVELSKAVNNTVNLGILRGKDILIISKIESDARDSLMRVVTQVGEPEAAYATSLGKMMLSDRSDEEIRQLFSDPDSMKKLTEKTASSIDELIALVRQVREDGYAIDTEELLLGITCISMPVKDYTGRIVAAISVSTQTVLLTEEAKLRIMMQLKLCCKGVSKALGYSD